MEIVFGDNDKKVLYSVIGFVCIDVVIKLVRGYIGRIKIIFMCEFYYGSIYGVIFIFVLSINMRRKMGLLLLEVYYFYYFDKNRIVKECLDEIEYVFVYYLLVEEVVVIFIELIVGDVGIIVFLVEWV